MTLPLVALAGLSVVGGLVNTPWRTSLEHFLDPAFEAVHLSPSAGGSTALALAAAAVAGRHRRRRPGGAAAIAAGCPMRPGSLGT